MFWPIRSSSGVSHEPDHYQVVPTEMFLTPRQKFWKLYCVPDIEVIKWSPHTPVQFDSRSFLCNENITRQSHSMRTLLAFFSGMKASSKITKTYPWNSDTELPWMWCEQGRYHRTATQPNHHETLELTLMKWIFVLLTNVSLALNVPCTTHWPKLRIL
jgi:hypothetical protein